MVKRLNVGAGRLEVLPDDKLRLFTDGTWTHLGSRWRGDSNPRHRSRDEIEHLYNITDYREWHWGGTDNALGIGQGWTHALAEHFLEHLWIDQAMALLHAVREVLEPNAVFRVVVPDADFRPEPEPTGFPEDFKWDEPEKHKTRWNYRTLSWAMKYAGFDVVVRRAYYPDGSLHTDGRFSPLLVDVDPHAGTLLAVQRRDSLIVDGIR